VAESGINERDYDTYISKRTQTGGDGVIYPNPNINISGSEFTEAYTRVVGNYWHVKVSSPRKYLKFKLRNSKEMIIDAMLFDTNGVRHNFFDIKRESALNAADSIFSIRFNEDLTGELIFITVITQ
jgi:hypothetical protein